GNTLPERSGVALSFCRRPVQDEDLARLSPLIFEHINMLGRYSFAVPEEVARGELRPLRNPDDDI
uniref:transposase n=1 Tax=Pseudomonas aeruginosa TaxID=287 RepID=UPI001F4AB809